MNKLEDLYEPVDRIVSKLEEIRANINLKFRKLKIL